MFDGKYIKKKKKNHRSCVFCSKLIFSDCSYDTVDRRYLDLAYLE